MAYNFFSRRNFLKYSSKNLFKAGILSYFLIPLGITPLYANILKNEKHITYLHRFPYISMYFRIFSYFFVIFRNFS